MSGLTPSQRKNGMKDATCSDCGVVWSVRRDTHPKRCKRCACAMGGKAMNGRYRVARIPCAACAKPIRASIGYKYCSVECRKSQGKVARQCKKCRVSFEVYKPSLTGKTNASGNFCSRPCYEKWLCNTERVTGRGSQWLKIRTQIKGAHPFCALCGARDGLQVHHIAPFRLSFDNSVGNLIPLCVKHHKVVETITHDIETTGSTPEDMTLILGSMLREHQMATAYRIGVRNV